MATHILTKTYREWLGADGVAKLIFEYDFDDKQMKMLDELLDKKMSVNIITLKDFQLEKRNVIKLQ